MSRSDSLGIDDGTIEFDIVVSRLPQDGLSTRFEASEKDRVALAAFLGVLAVEAMTAEIRVSRRGREMIAVAGRVTATLVQASVVTLDPVTQTIDEPVDLLFVPADSRLVRQRGEDEAELDLDPEAEDLPETYSGDRIALGAGLREIVALALDPYPRGSGIVFDGLDTDPEPSGGRTSPFASLTRLKSEPPTD